MTRPILYVSTVLALMALAFWAYRENYATQRALRELAGLQSEIAGLREAIQVQRAEWAYLNRPDRLRDLVALNFETLALLPLDPGQFATAQDVVMPLPPLGAPLNLNPVTLSGDIEGDPL